MQFDQKTVESLLHLARIGINHPSDLLGIEEDLNRIVKMVDQISLANTEHVEPMAHPFKAKQRLRADETTEQDESDHLLKLASKTEANLFLVPQVIE